MQATVRFAAAHGLKVSPRGSGHNWSGVALQDGIVLDLSALDDVVIDAAARIADVGPALNNRTLARMLGEHGLAFPLGHCGSVSISGYLLGGGLGWNSERWGLGCHNVIGLDVVTADGELRRVSADENPEIYWAARGAGPAFFGVVTRYRLALHPLPRAITTSIWTYPIDRVAEVEAWMLATKAVTPDNVEFTAIMASAPPPLAGRAAKVAMGIVTVFADDPAEARTTLAQAAARAPSGAIDVQEHLPTPFDGLYDALDPFYPKGARFAVDSSWSEAPDGAYLAALAERVLAAPSAASFALGAVVPPSPPGAPEMPDTAFSMAGSGFGLVYAIWQDPAEDAEHLAWLRASADALADRTIGHYVGEADLDRPGRLRACFSPEAWDRLRILRARYDPAGTFDRTRVLSDAETDARPEHASATGRTAA